MEQESKPNNGLRWTAIEVESMVNMAKDGLITSEIAHKLGRSSSAVNSKFFSILPHSSKSGLTKALSIQMKTVARGMVVQLIANDPGYDWVRYYLSGQKFGLWNPDEERRMIEMFQSGCLLVDIAEELGGTQKQVANWLVALGQIKSTSEVTDRINEEYLRNEHRTRPTGVMFMLEAGSKLNGKSVFLFSSLDAAIEYISKGWESPAVAGRQFFLYQIDTAVMEHQRYAPGKLYSSGKFGTPERHTPTYILKSNKVK